jgi:glycerophosphoryl diester phosphodiesterase
LEPPGSPFSRTVRRYPHPFLASHRPLVFAHRGGSLLAPENTFPAFDRGIDAGADGIELDVHLSRDKVVVVHHDATLGRTTDRSGPIAALTADELARVDAGFRYRQDGGYPFRGRGVGIPRLRDVLARYSSARFIIEMKQDTDALARATITAVRDAGSLERTCLGSFGGRALSAAREHEPLVATSAGRREVAAALFRAWIRRPSADVPYDVLQVPETYRGIRVVSPSFVREAGASGVPVQIWTVDAERDIERLLDWGVQGIISDRPDIAVAVVARWRGPR